MSTTKPADPNSPVSRYIAGLEGLSDDQLRRAAQIALAAIDQILASDDALSDQGAIAAEAAYNALQDALA